MNAPGKASLISIIIPVLDEAQGIISVLQALQSFRQQHAEIIVVDGGSSDGTPRLAAPLADQVTVSSKGRGCQMNAGAALAQGQVLLFLHADTQLPRSALTLIDEAIRRGANWGRFDVKIDGNAQGLRLVASMMNWRSRLTGIATGDQAIFVTQQAFAQVGGFADIPLMEDIDFSSRLRALSHPACLAEKVITSGRRWEKHGVMRTILLMWRLRLRFFFGANPNELAREYGYAPRKQ